MESQTTRPLAVGAALILLVAGTSATRAIVAQQPSRAPAATPEGAVDQFIAAANAAYAGDCAGAVSPDARGKICSKFVAQQGSVRAYLVGRTFSEYTGWVFVKQVATGWIPAGMTPFDESASTLQVPWPAPAGSLQAPAPASG